MTQHKTGGRCALGIFTALGVALSSFAVASAQGDLGQGQPGGPALAMTPSVVSPIAVLDAWVPVDATPADVLAGQPSTRPVKYRPSQLDVQKMRGFLSAAPMDPIIAGAPLAAARTVQSPIRLSVPMPDGTNATFEIVETQILSPELAALYPHLKTYRGQCVSEGEHFGASAVFDFTDFGFHAQIRSALGTAYVVPVTQGNITDYASYYSQDEIPAGQQPLGVCGVPADAPAAIVLRGARVATGPTLRTYRLACATTAEFTAAFGGSPAGVLANLTTVVNNINGVYRPEVGVGFTLITGPAGNPTQLLYTNSATDPYDNSSLSTMLGQNQSNLDSVLTSGGYDIGHVFGSLSSGGVVGIASLGVVCVNGNKARGASGYFTSEAVTSKTNFTTTIHEIGHQFNAPHIFNTSNANCVGQRSSTNCVEPGAGSTIMGYGGGGSCGSDDFLPNDGQDLYFNSISLDNITAFSANNATCSVNTATGNTSPVIPALTNRAIPLNTPFVLTGTATLGTGPGGRTLTYTWEQRTVSASAQALGVDVGTNAINRSRQGSTGVREVPPLTNVISNSIPSSDLLPTLARSAGSYPWRLTVRDNFSGGGGVNSQNMTIQCVNTGSAFLVSSPNGGEVLPNGPTTVTWNVAGTTAAPISTANVAIRLSTDGGLTYPTILAASTPNDGSQSVTLPAISTSQARIRIEAVGNIFYDISNLNFTIAPQVAFIYTGNRTTVDTIGLGNGNGNGRLDPGEDQINVNFEVRNSGVSTATNVVGTLTSLTPTVTVVTAASAYPDLAPAGAGAFGATPYVISISPSHVCGDPIVLQLDVSSTQGAGPASISAPSGSTGLPLTFSYTGPAVAIPDNLTSGVDITVPVSGVGGTVASVEFRFDGSSCSNNPASTTVGLSHPVVASLTGTLFAPSGTNRLIFNRPGGASNAGSNFCNTLFRDDNTIVNTFTTAGAPYSGTYRTNQTFTPFVGQNPNGNWRFRAADTAVGNTGSVRAFSIIITGTQPVCDAPISAPAQCNPADICGVGATYDAGVVDIGPDNALTIEDFLNFLAAFGDEVGCPGTAPCNPADICGVGATYDAGTVDIGPDGALTIEDFLNFLAAFGDATGCP